MFVIFSHSNIFSLKLLEPNLGDIFTCLKILVWQLEKSIFYVMRSNWCNLSKKKQKKTFMRHHMCDGIVTGYERVVITTGQSYNIVPQ